MVDQNGVPVQLQDFNRRDFTKYEEEGYKPYSLKRSYNDWVKLTPVPVVKERCIELIVQMNKLGIKTDALLGGAKSMHAIKKYLNTISADKVRGVARLLFARLVNIQKNVGLIIRQVEDVVNPVYYGDD